MLFTPYYFSFYWGTAMDRVFRLMYFMIMGLTLAVVFSGCTDKNNPKSNGVTNLPSSLAKLEGQYVLQEQTRAYQYADKIKLESIISAEDRQQVLLVLVACLDDTSLTKTTLNGKPLMLGVLCYQALTQTVYYEPTDSHGDIAGHWPGHLTPNATISELQAAKKAWRHVLENKSYIFL